MHRKKTSVHRGSHLQSSDLGTVKSDRDANKRLDLAVDDILEQWTTNSLEKAREDS